MDLLSHLFEIKSETKTKEGFDFRIRLNPEHEIYRGHFPGYPITPGVIQLQIVHSLLEYALKIRISLKKIQDCKFLSVLNPEIVEELCFKIDVREDLTGELIVTALGNFDDGIFLKLKANYDLQK